jgi:UDP:flavonoid glycosyltransferase YjiC (YdhE family)
VNWLEKGSSYLNIRIIGMADLVLIQDLPPPYTISTTTYEPPEWLKHRFEYLGFIIRKTPEELPEKQILREKYFDDGDKANSDSGPLIYAPLAGPITARKQLMELLIEPLKDFNGKVIISMGMYGKKLDKQYGSVHIMNWVEDRFELLKAADLTIARPGLATIGDFLRFGIPSILVPTLNHPEQMHNAESVERLGVGKLLEQNEISSQNLKENIKTLTENKDVKKSIIKMKSVMIENDGLKKLKGIILNKLNL